MFRIIRGLTFVERQHEKSTAFAGAQVVLVTK